ncbi:hypothetical protein C4D60_Mb04t26670 [Musa balbisiana]|uniref:MYB-CC type transcription factor LHEQLE-containing domain-containing protein n=1 Tax=Musa balbisiana TaxID=52838 RepID=A0A4S8KEX0_MUSBA|nr:hypothetical protein C4D60_Mb04t26670 [Musa balbisiana]
MEEATAVDLFKTMDASAKRRELERVCNCFDLVFWVDPPTRRFDSIGGGPQPEPGPDGGPQAAASDGRLTSTSDSSTPSPSSGPPKVQATPKAIMQTMGAKGLTLFHLKSHLQKYRSGKQSGKEMTEQSKDGRSRNTVGAPAFGGQEVKEALRAQMEVQRLLEQVEIVLKLFVGLLDQVQKHLQIRKDVHQKYIDSLLAKAYKIASEQIASNGSSTTKQEAPDMTTRAICSPSEPLSPSLLHQLSMSSVNLHNSSCKTSPSSTTATTIEGQFFYQKFAELGNQPC